MDTPKNSDVSLETIPANRRLLDELSSKGLISSDARNYALSLLHPALNWGLWASRALLAVGVSLILSGVIYFFAFNWTKITPEVKLGSIQLVMLACLGAAYYYGLGSSLAKVLALVASVLVGVFWAVFGQIYQTGADAYNLFMMWTLLVLPWVILFRFAPLWLVWLVISNVFLGLYWEQAALPSSEAEMLIVSCLAVFNGVFLALRELLVRKGNVWLRGQWTRVALAVPILVLVLIPTIILIVEPSGANYSITIGAALSAIVHVAFYVCYRYAMPDMWTLSSTVLSACVIVETAVFKVLLEIFHLEESVLFLLFLLMGFITLGVFSFAIIMLRRIAKKMKARRV